MNIQPIEDRVLVEAHPVDTETSGFYDHAKTKERPREGTVIAVGPGRYFFEDGAFVLQPMPVKAGDTIFFGRNIGTEITIEGKDYIIMRLGEAFATL